MGHNECGHSFSSQGWKKRYYSYARGAIGDSPKSRREKQFFHFREGCSTDLVEGSFQKIHL
jgi:hypothetical protein